jgi:hypothetical protein
MELAALAAVEVKYPRERLAGDETLGKLQKKLEARDGRAGDELELEADGATLELPLPVELDVELELGLPGESEPDADEDGEGRGKRGQLRTPERQRADQSQARKRGIDAELRSRDAGHLGAGSTGDIGTWPRSSRTMSSDRKAPKLLCLCAAHCGAGCSTAGVGT